MRTEASAMEPGSPDMGDFVLRPSELGSPGTGELEPRARPRQVARGAGAEPSTDVSAMEPGGPNVGEFGLVLLPNERHGRSQAEHSLGIGDRWHQRG